MAYLHHLLHVFGGDRRLVLAARLQGAAHVGRLDDLGLQAAQDAGQPAADLRVPMDDQHLHADEGYPRAAGRDPAPDVRISRRRLPG